MKLKSRQNNERKRKLTSPISKSNHTDRKTKHQKLNEKNLAENCKTDSSKQKNKEENGLDEKENAPITNNNSNKDGGNDTESIEKNAEDTENESEDEPELSENKGKEESSVSKDEKNEENDNPYDSMVKSLTNRGKGKRQVRLVESHLVQFAFGDMDSDDDEDFVLDQSMRSDYSSAGSEDGDDETQSNDGGDSSDDSSSKSSDSENESVLEKHEEQTAANDVTVESANIEGEAMDDAANQKSFVSKRPVLVCGVCLESRENASDEILECDNCGITVHEGCYGEVSDEIDDDKSDSDAPTEPWFCELCKSNTLDTPYCELCPNVGGIYKQTDTGKWVHLVCALYTPDVGFRNVTLFRAVVLDDIRNNLWGSRECQICANADFSRTGVCIGCDVGLCKTTFHVTCAQRNGFLSDIPDRADADEDSPDVLYAHCKMHSVRHEVKKRKSSWMTFESRLSNFKRNEIDKERIDTALVCARKKYSDYRATVSAAKFSEEQPRLLSSCPEACIMLARKAEMLGVSLKRDFNLSEAVVSGRLSKFELNFTPDSVAYFFKRENDIRDLIKAKHTYEPTLSNLRATQKRLTQETQALQEKFDEIVSEKAKLENSHKTLNKTLSRLSGKTIAMPSFLSKKKGNLKNDKLNEATNLLNSVVNKCATCKSIENQHLLARCGTCRKYYHLACVDPPLTRMPKTSGSYVWQCTECDSSDESSDQDNFPTKRVRAKREPEKFVPGENKDKENSKVKNMKKLKKSEKKETSLTSAKKTDLPNKNSSKTKTFSDKPSSQHPPRRKKKVTEDFTENCSICKDTGNSKSLVQCDSCKKYYHFKTCLDPPYTQSPKGKFYGWECESCNDSD